MGAAAFPLCLLAMEASAQMEARGLVLDLEWVPREASKEADALSNMVFAGFSADRRIALDVAKVPFLVLPELLAASMGFFQPARAARRTEGDQGYKQRKADSLRVRDPW